MNTEIPEAERIQSGAVIRVVNDNPEFDAIPGREYVVDEYVTTEQGDAEQPYYALSDLPPNFGQYFAAVGDVKVVRSAADQAELMKIDANDLMKAIQDGLMSLFASDYEISETTKLREPPTEDDRGFEDLHDYPFGVEFYGRRPGGATFGGRIRLTGLWRTDG